MPLISQAHDPMTGLSLSVMGALFDSQLAIRRAKYVTDLQRADWLFEYAEGNAWRRGRDELQRLRAEQAIVDPSGELWRAYAPESYHNHLLAGA